jgi:hypothetical protein
MKGRLVIRETSDVSRLQGYRRRLQSGDGPAVDAALDLHPASGSAVKAERAIIKTDRAAYRAAHHKM